MVSDNVSNHYSGNEEEMQLPGTVHMIDMDGVLDVEQETDGIILHPLPSRNPNDPLRWSPKKKLYQFSLLVFWGFIQSVSTVWSGPVWAIWVEDLNTSYGSLNTSSGLIFIGIAIGCITLQPIGLKVGKRSVYLACTLLQIVGNAIISQATNMKYLYIGNAIVGFSSAPMFSLIEISSIDMFFQHERAAKLGWAVFALYSGVALGPLATGYVTETLSWRWCCYILIIIFAVLFFVQLFTMEDSTFIRENPTKLENEILTQIKSRETMNSHSPEEIKQGSTVNISQIKSVDSSIPLRTYAQKTKLYDTEYGDKRNWLKVFIQPFYLARFPAAIIAGVLQGVQQMWLSLVANTQASFYSVPPYSFNTAQIGLTNIGLLVGILLGMYHGGQLNDKISLFLAKRNKGVFEPEFRLWSMGISLVANAGGLIAYGIGANNGDHWAISVCLGQGLLGFSMSSITGIAYAYCSDSLPDFIGESVVFISFLNNCIATIFTFCITIWMEANGIALMTWLMFMLSVVINGIAIVFVFAGKPFRRMTSSMYLAVKEKL